jgi:hypothetical protein
VSANGPVATSSDRLSAEQRDQLPFLAQHNLVEIRREAKVGRAKLDRAIARDVLDPAVIARLSEFLTAG